MGQGKSLKQSRNESRRSYVLGPIASATIIDSFITKGHIHTKRTAILEYISIIDITLQEKASRDISVPRSGNPALFTQSQHSVETQSALSPK